MTKVNGKKLGLLFLMGSLSTASVHAAVGIDRTRLIFGGDKSSVSLNISNRDDRSPFLAQGWIEDPQGNKNQLPFIVLPPIQRLEPGANSQVKVQKLPTATHLPQNKESLFYFVMQEIPPKGKEDNMLQIAIQNKIKLMYRPYTLAQDAMDVEKAWASQVSLIKQGKQALIQNNSPYHLTLLHIVRGGTEQALEEFQPVLIPPFDSVSVAVNDQRLGSSPTLKYINDYGGIGQLPLECKGVRCLPKGKVS